MIAPHPEDSGEERPCSPQSCDKVTGAVAEGEICQLNKPGQVLLKTAMKKLQLSARAFDRILKVARTCADLGGSEEIKIEYLAEAIQYRGLDREGWAQ